MRKYKIAGVLEDVLWTGWLPAKKGWSYIRRSEVGLSAFPRGFLLYSASPTKVPEDVALGIPVVCNDNPDQAQVIEISGAGICVPYTAGHFADAVISLFDLTTESRIRMREAGLQNVSLHRDYRPIGQRVALSYRALIQAECNLRSH